MIRLYRTHDTSVHWFSNAVWQVTTDEDVLREALKRIAAENAPIHSAIDAVHAARRRRPNMWPTE